jgi:hypothetical protein
MKAFGNWFRSVFTWTLVAEGVWLGCAYTLLSPQISTENWERMNKCMQAEVLLLGLVFGTMWFFSVRRWK